MKLLYIFDNNKKAGSFDFKGNYGTIEEIALFPLTYDTSVIDKVKSSLAHGKAVKISLINTAEKIDAEIMCLRSKVVKWSAQLGEAKIGNKKLKEWFLLPKYNVSSWWFTLLSEKNTWKTDAFLKIAQVNAIKKLMTEDQYKFCAVSVSDKTLRNSIIALNDSMKIKSKKLSSGYPTTMESRIKMFVNNAGLFGNILLGLSYLIRYCLHVLLTRKHLSSEYKRLFHPGSLIFISYFPSVDNDFADKGIFRNKYALALQEKLNEMNIPVMWLFLYVRIGGHTFTDALHLAKKLKKGGETVYMLEEFVNFRDLINVFLLWSRYVAQSAFIIYFKKIEQLLFDHEGREVLPIIRALWFRSFCGPVGVEGIYFLSAFRRFFESSEGANDCLYYCEMHAWEKAMNAMAKRTNTSIRTIGFQHSAISKNEFQYFYDKDEISFNNSATGMPLPDILACNGEAEYSILREIGYANLNLVESVRYMYISKILTLRPNSRQGAPVLLVAGSNDRYASRELISLVYGAFPKVDKFDICFKAHPAMPFEDLFKELKIDIDKAGYTIFHGNISEYLERTWSVLTPTGVVAIEAMAYGCEIIIPFFPDSVCINPLVGFEDYYHKVTSPENLIDTVRKIFSGYTLKSLNDYRNFVKNYWELNPSLEKWANLLSSKTA